MRLLRAIVVLLIVEVVGSCGASTGGPESAPTLPPATTYREFAAGACRAFDALWAAVGNPDTGDTSDLRDQFDQAESSRNTAEVDRVAGLVIARLDAGRREAVAAAGWEPGKPMMVQLDRLLAAYQAEARAKQAAAHGQAGGATPQQVWEAAGGLDAWKGMFAAGAAMPHPAQPFGRCPNVPISF